MTHVATGALTAGVMLLGFALHETTHYLVARAAGATPVRFAWEDASKPLPMRRPVVHYHTQRPAVVWLVNLAPAVTGYGALASWLLAGNQIAFTPGVLIPVLGVAAYTNILPVRDVQYAVARTRQVAAETTGGL